MFREEILKEDCVVKCESEYQIKNLFKWLDSKGYIWSTGEPLFDFVPKFENEVYIYIYPDKEIRYDGFIRGKKPVYKYSEIIKKSCLSCEYSVSSSTENHVICDKHKIVYSFPNPCNNYALHVKTIKPENKDTTIPFMLNYLPDVKKIIHNDPATILIFKDGSKSVVIREQEHDLEKAILYAWVKKHKKKKIMFDTLLAIDCGGWTRAFTPNYYDKYWIES